MSVTLKYENQAGNFRRTYHIARAVGENLVRTRLVEERYDHISESWGEVENRVRSYNLADDGETLLGDGSNWSGTGEHWGDYLTDWFKELLVLRFPFDDHAQERIEVEEECHV